MHVPEISNKWFSEQAIMVAKRKLKIKFLGKKKEMWQNADFQPLTRKDKKKNISSQENEHIKENNTKERLRRTKKNHQEIYS